jgi:hypothetical protein
MSDKWTFFAILFVVQLILDCFGPPPVHFHQGKFTTAVENASSIGFLAGVPLMLIL